MFCSSIVIEAFYPLLEHLQGSSYKTSAVMGYLPSPLNILCTAGEAALQEILEVQL